MGKNGSGVSLGFGIASVVFGAFGYLVTNPRKRRKRKKKRKCDDICTCDKLCNNNVYDIDDVCSSLNSDVDMDSVCEIMSTTHYCALNNDDTCYIDSEVCEDIEITGLTEDFCDFVYCQDELRLKNGVDKSPTLENHVTGLCILDANDYMGCLPDGSIPGQLKILTLVEQKEEDSCYTVKVPGLAPSEMIKFIKPGQSIQLVWTKQGWRSLGGYGVIFL